ncbi:GNAT family N-acetyltransferase [Fodinicola acaciae]|uniref:GNAT family N-acetyltransferase n=1 Tax=Fodinicola acaciae TaxID=2681555 RepID=UPI0013D148DF|nr:GNAT family N-acetyltransferase [Fodinicola acaciae]
MISLRSIGPDETSLVSATGDGAEAVTIRGYFDDLLRKGSTTLDWCMLAERDGTPVGSAALSAFPGGETPASIVLIEAPWHDPALAAEVVAAVSGRARDLGAGELTYAIDTPRSAPRFMSHPAEREAAFLAAGFGLLRDGMRWRWTAEKAVPVPDDRLVFRTLPEIGRESYVDILAATMEGSADSELAAMTDAGGLRGAGEKIFDLMMGFDHAAEWYEIGFDQAGDPVGVSMPARNATMAVIGHVGVTPAHRRKGYATAIVARGTAILAAAGEKTIVGDCDSSNTGIIKAFTANGYDNFVNRREFGLTFS